MKNKKFLVSAVLILSAFLLTGCFGINFRFANIRNTLIEDLDCRFNKEIEFSVGPVGIMFAGAFVRFTDEDIELEEILDGISRVQVGVYKPLDFIGDDLSLSVPDDLNRDLSDNGWKSIVKSTGGGELTGIYIKYNHEKPVSMLIVSLTQKELVIAEVTGDLEKISEVIAENHIPEFSLSKN